jgi:TolA-binding protein
LTRREIKHDEFVSIVSRAARWLEEHRDRLLPAAGAVVVALVLVVGGYSWWQSREEAALSALGEVEELYHATVEGQQAPVFQGSITGRTFPTSEEKYTAVLEAVDTMTQRYSRGAAVAQALYYRGLALRELGRQEEAAAAFEEVLARRPSSLVCALTRVALAETHEAAGLWSEAEGVYRALFDEAPEFFPREMALLGRARCLEQVNELGEARALYQQVIDVYPGSPYEQEARERLEQSS